MVLSLRNMIKLTEVVKSMRTHQLIGTKLLGGNPLYLMRIAHEKELTELVGNFQGKVYVY